MPWPDTNDVANHWKHSYQDDLLANQYLVSKLEAATTSASLIGDEGYFDFTGPPTATSVGLDTGNAAGMIERHGGRFDEFEVDWALSETRRRIKPKHFYFPLMYAIEDANRAMRDLSPNSQQQDAVAGMVAANKDDCILKGLEASAYQQSSVAAGFVKANITSANVLSSAVSSAVNLTTDSIISALEQLAAWDVPDSEEKFIICHPNQMYALMKDGTDTRIQSADFSSKKVLDDGKIHSYLGATMITTTRIPLFHTAGTHLATGGTADDQFPLPVQSSGYVQGTHNVRPAYVTTKSALLFGSLRDPEVSLSVIPMRKNALLFAVYQDVACVRSQENRSIRIECVE